MIGWLQGTLAEKTPTRVILDVQGVGYELAVPLSTFEAVGDVGQAAKLLTYLYVREDALQLYGFSTAKEKRMFLSLLSVSGVGPKLALGILSRASVDDLSSRIASGDVESLTSLPGIGKKTAQRLVMELKDKFGDFQEAGVSFVAKSPAETSRKQEAVLALVSLGFTRAVAEKTLTGILASEPDLPVDELIRRALQ